MKNWKKFLIAVFLFNFSPLTFALDDKMFHKLADYTIRQVDMGIIGDIDALLAIQEQLINIGREGGAEYLKSGKEKNPEALRLVLENAEKMKNLSLDEIETLWHEGNFLKSKGIDIHEIEHFGVMNNLMDAVIHPATSYILIKEYKKTGNSDLLQQVKAELIEVLEHIRHIDDENNSLPSTSAH